MSTASRSRAEPAFASASTRTRSESAPEGAEASASIGAGSVVLVFLAVLFVEPVGEARARFGQDANDFHLLVDRLGAAGAAASRVDDRDVERRAASLVALLVIGAAKQEGADRSSASRAGRPVQRRCAVLVGDVGIGAGVDE